MKTGDKVCTANGVEIVLTVEPSRVVTYQSALRGAGYHPSTIRQVYWSELQQRYVTVPESEEA